MANTDINPIVIDTTVSDIVEAAYESGYLAGKIVATGKGYWRGVRWGVLACGVGYGVYKLLTKTCSDADDSASDPYAKYYNAPDKKYRPNWDGKWKTRVEMLQKELDEALEKAEKEL